MLYVGGYESYNLTYNTYTAVVLPKSCSLKSLVQYDASEVLFETEIDRYIESHDAAINRLLSKIEGDIGKIFLEPNSDGSSRIDKSAIPSMCNINLSDLDDTQKESAESTGVVDSTQATIEDSNTQINTIPETTTLDTEVETRGLTAQKKRIWRVVGYTSSGEPCIEEHEPETSSQNPTFGPKTVFTPGTSVVSDSSTITPSVYEGHSPTDCANNLEEKNREITVLERDLWQAKEALADATKENQRLEQELLDANGRCEDQEKQIEDYKLNMESLSNEITSLKESIRIDQETRAIEKKTLEEFTRSFLK